MIPRRCERRRVVAPESEFPIGIGEGDVVEFVGSANGGLVGDGGGEGPEAEGCGGAWEGAEGGRAFAESRGVEGHGHGHGHG